MKKIAAKVITISSQLLVASVFLFLLFSNDPGNGNDKSVVVNNSNFNKMADRTLVLFEEEKKNESSLDDTVVPLEDENDKVQEVVEEIKEEDKEVEEEVIVTPDEPNLFYDKAVIMTEVGTITGYGPDCRGCSGVTASGHNLHESVYYEDSEFGTVRILAADRSIPFYSIFRVSNIPGMDPFIAIVLDTGGNVGYGKGTLFDLAFESEATGVVPLTQNVTFEMLRSGK